MTTDQESLVPMLPKDGTRNCKDRQRIDFEVYSITVRMLLRLKSVIIGRPGIIWAFISGCTFALQVSLLHSTITFTNSAMALFFRSPVLLLSIFFVSWEDSDTYEWYDMFLFIITSVIDVIAVGLFLYAMNILDVGDATAIITNVTIPSAFIAFIFMGERLNKYEVCLIVINGIGLVLIANPSVLSKSNQPIESVREYLTAMTACVFSFIGSALNPNLSRLLFVRGVNNPHLLTSLIGFNGIIIASMVLNMTNDWTVPNTYSEWLVTGALGLSTVVSTVTFYKALATEEVRVVTIIGTVAIPLTYVYQAICANQVLVWYSVIGAMLTVTTTIIFLSQDEVSVDTH